MKISTAAALAIAAVLAGCAAPGSQTSAPAAAAREVPALKVSFDCGTCQPRDNSAQLIAEGYNEAVTQAGAKVNPAMQAVLVVREYTARDDTARFLVGAFAGKDEIKASVTYGSQKFDVEDYYRNAWLGIDALARKIGELTFQNLK
jgi:hypothetical protein